MLRSSRWPRLDRDHHALPGADAYGQLRARARPTSSCSACSPTSGMFTIVVREIPSGRSATSRWSATRSRCGAALARRSSRWPSAICAAAAVLRPGPRGDPASPACRSLLGMLNTSLVAVFQARLRMERAVIGDVVGRAGGAAASWWSWPGSTWASTRSSPAAGVGAAVTLALTSWLARPLAPVRPRGRAGRCGDAAGGGAAAGPGAGDQRDLLPRRHADHLALAAVREVGLYTLAWRVFELGAGRGAIIVLGLPAAVGLVATEDSAWAPALLQAASDVFWPSACRWRPAGRAGAGDRPTARAGPGSRAPRSRCESCCCRRPPRLRQRGVRLRADRQGAPARRAVAERVGLVFNVALNFALVPRTGSWRRRGDARVRVMLIADSGWVGDIWG